jgi:pimeloyl-ACP methyl ester carboxylesterase
MRPQTPVPLVVLLHGLGATGAVWEPVVRELRAEGLADVLVPDLAGHGEARALGDYTVAGLAAEIAERLPPGRPWVAAGHSLGGYVALALAGGAFSPPPLAVFSLGAKLTFTPEEQQRAREAADRPRRVFASHAEALRPLPEGVGSVDRRRAGRTSAGTRY